MSSISGISAAATTGIRWRIRALAVVGAAVAAVVVWVVARALVADLRQPSFGSGEPQQLSAGLVVATAVAGGALAWAVLALLERVVRDPRRVWSLLAPLALLVSFGGPLSGHGISAGNRVALVLMHVAVAAVLIPLYRSTAPERWESRAAVRAR